MTLLNHDFTILWDYFYKNFIVLNLDQWSFIITGAKDELQTAFVSNNVTIENRKEEKALGINLITNLTFPRNLILSTDKLSSEEINSILISNIVKKLPQTSISKNCLKI